MDNTTTIDGKPRRGVLVLRALSRFVPGMAFIGVLIFAPTGGLDWARGWRYLATLSAMMILTLSYFVVRDPSLLERRLRMREKRSTQKRFLAWAWIVLFPIFIIPGFDYRLGWSQAPEAVAWAGLALTAIGYAVVFAVMRANSYASRVVEIQEGQKVIDSGPYAIVRHPMYAAMILFYLASPLALGSWWALIPALAYIPILAVRARDEEIMLRAGLPGYVEYCAKARWRMIPGIW